jgi:hypothetical protein
MEGNMSERDIKLDEISNQLNENILAVKGTLELVDTSVDEDELHELLLKSIERTDIIQKISNDMIALLKNCFEKLDEKKE